MNIFILIFKITFLLYREFDASNYQNRIYQFSRLKIPKSTELNQYYDIFCIFSILDVSEPLMLEIETNLTNFFFFGDWGGISFYPYKTKIQEKIYKLMKYYSIKYRVHFHLGFGDNFYPSGVNDKYDLRFKVN